MWCVVSKYVKKRSVFFNSITHICYGMICKVSGSIKIFRKFCAWKNTAIMLPFYIASSSKTIDLPPSKTKKMIESVISILITNYQLRHTVVFTYNTCGIPFFTHQFCDAFTFWKTVFTSCHIF